MISRTDLEVCKNFGQIEVQNSFDRLANNLSEVIFRPMCPTFLEILGSFVHQVKLRQMSAAMDFTQKRLNKLGQLKSFFHEQTKLVR